jgi:hypothetical protein
MHVATSVRTQSPNSTQPTASTVSVSRQLDTLSSCGGSHGKTPLTDVELLDIQLQSPPVRVLCIMPAAAPCPPELNCCFYTVRCLTQSAEVIASQIMELAMLARKCTAPSTIHSIYAAPNSVVHTALNSKSIKLNASHVSRNSFRGRK